MIDNDNPTINNLLCNKVRDLVGECYKKRRALIVGRWGYLDNRQRLLLELSRGLLYISPVPVNS